MTEDAPWMGVTPQPPSESEPRVVQIAEWLGANWTEDQARALLTDMIHSLRADTVEMGVDPQQWVLRVELSAEVPWAG